MTDAFVVDVMLNACGQTLTKRTNRDKDVSDRMVIEKALEALRENPLQADSSIRPSVGGSKGPDTA